MRDHLLAVLALRPLRRDRPRELRVGRAFRWLANRIHGSLLHCPTISWLPRPSIIHGLRGKQKVLANRSDVCCNAPIEPGGGLVPTLLSKKDRQRGNCKERVLHETGHAFGFPAGKGHHDCTPRFGRAGR